MLFKNYVEAYEMAESLANAHRQGRKVKSRKGKKLVGGDADDQQSLAGGGISTNNVPSVARSSGSSVTLRTPPNQKEEKTLKDLKAKVKRVLVIIHHARATYTEQQKELATAKAVHLDRAKARCSSGNKMGALLSLKKLKSLEKESAKTRTVIDYLETQEVGLMSLLRKIKTARSLHYHLMLGQKHLMDSVIPFNVDDIYKSLASELSQFSNISEQVNTILAEENPDHSVVLTDEQLLQELDSL